MTSTVCGNGHPVGDAERFCRTCGEPVFDRSEPTVGGVAVTCANGHSVAAGLQFCRECGAPMPIRSPAPVGLAPPTTPTVGLPPPLGMRAADIPAPPNAPGRVLISPARPTPVAAPQPRPAEIMGNRRRWPWIAALVGFARDALFLVVLRPWDNGGGDKATTSPSGPCEPGTRWEQKFSPYAEGALIGVTALPEVAIIRGGAHVGFPSPEEFALMGFTSYIPVSAEDYTGIDLAPPTASSFRNGPSKEGRVGSTSPPVAPYIECAITMRFAVSTSRPTLLSRFRPMGSMGRRASPRPARC